jgi:DmsE family decaheme c-type cytochrome
VTVTAIRNLAKLNQESSVMAVLCWLSILLGAGGFAWSSASAEDIVGYETCVDCHEDYLPTLSGTAHDIETARADLVLVCASCHSGASVHIDDPSADNIGNPATSSVGDVTALCTQCHSPHAEMGNVGFDPHFNQETACTDCHTVHSGQEMLRPADPATLCSQCHVAVSETLTRRSNHPLSDGAVSCVSCHSFTGAGEPTVGHGSSANCYSCHPEQSGPFLFEHQATLTFAVEGGGCVECHNPHGSANERLLTDPGGTLCQQCHGTPPGHRTAHGGFGVQYQCVECHSEIHGSNHSSQFLDPDLNIKLPLDCYQSGCHNP